MSGVIRDNKGRFTKGSEGPWKGTHRLDFKGSKNPNWKGSKAAYSNKHHWVRRWYGKASQCEICPKNRANGNMIHWASRSHRCKRVRSDWVQLCVSHHKLYDLGKIKLNKYVSQ